MNSLWKITAIVFVMIAYLGFVSAELSFDNIKSFDDKIGTYGKVTIRDWFGLQSLAELELKTNTERCANDCSAETEIIMHQTGSLVDDIRFMTSIGNDWVKQDIINYDFYVQTGTKQVDVNDYGLNCVNGEYIAKNDSYRKVCTWGVTGTHKENKPIWSAYNLGDEVEPGTYRIKLEGKKKADKKVDWQITSQGKLIDEWAVWDTTAIRVEWYDGGVIIGYRLQQLIGEP